MGQPTCNVPFEEGGKAFISNERAKIQYRNSLVKATPIYGCTSVTHKAHCCSFKDLVVGKPGGCWDLKIN